MGTTPSQIFRKQLNSLPRGTPISLERLTDAGLAAKAVARLSTDGWLKRLGRGVYLLPGDTLDRDATLSWLAGHVPGLHVGGKTALAWRGVRHNISMTEVLSLWGTGHTPIPPWFKNAFPCHYQATNLFDEALPADAGIAPLPASTAPVPVSVPERALLELLSDAGKRQSLEETTHLVESLRSLRPELLEQLMAHLTRIKVARLAQALATSLDLPWRDIAARHSRRLGGGARWVARAKTGERIDLKGPA
jgi:hypothetical protein